MQPQSPSPPPGARSLPPVTPPTGKFIVQLFLVPGLIVAVIVGLLLLVYWLFGGPRSPESFLRKLDDPNPEVRWRAAADLSQVLPRDPRLASNADFCLELTRRLVHAVRDSTPDEKLFLEKFPQLAQEYELSNEEVRKEAQKERAKLEPKRNYVQFLTASLGNFLVPTAAPVLGWMAEDRFPAGDDGPWITEPKPPLELRALTLRRRGAIFALANLGDNLRKFDRLPAIEQNLILEQMRKLDETAQNQAKKWNHAALECLEKRKAGQFTTMDVDQSLIQAANSEDPVTREFAAYALGFWKGNATQNQRMDEALVKLASDDGRGRDEINKFQGEEPGKTREVLRQPGLLIQINATHSLLRQGSDKVRTSKVKELLDEKQLGEDIQIEKIGGQEGSRGKRQPNQSKASMTVVGTLRALREYYRQKPADSLPGVEDQVKKLTTSDNPDIQQAARQVVKELEAPK